MSFRNFILFYMHKCILKKLTNRTEDIFSTILNKHLHTFVAVIDSCVISFLLKFLSELAKNNRTFFSIPIKCDA